MIYCGKLSTRQIIKILGIFQIAFAIIVTAVGIAIVVKFREVHHEKGSNYEYAIDYIDTPWTTKYGAAIWLGLIMLIAGAAGSFADIKPEKSKYTYATLIINVVVIIVSIVLLVYSEQAIRWFDTCQYTFHDQEKLTVFSSRACSTKDKEMGADMYWAVFVSCILIVPISIAMMVFLISANKILFEDLCDGVCVRKMVYKAKGGGNTTVTFKTKNTHEFNQEMVSPTPFYPVSQ